VKDILIDSGASISVVARDLLPSKVETFGKVPIRGWDGRVDDYDTAVTEMEVGEYKFPILVAMMN